MGTLDFASFARCVYDQPQLMGTAANLRRLFSKFDADGSGELDRKELTALVLYYLELRGLPPPESSLLEGYVDAAFAQADTDASATIDFPELCRFIATSNLSLQVRPAYTALGTGASRLARTAAMFAPASARCCRPQCRLRRRWRCWSRARRRPPPPPRARPKRSNAGA